MTRVNSRIWLCRVCWHYKYHLSVYCYYYYYYYYQRLRSVWSHFKTQRHRRPVLPFRLCCGYFPSCFADCYCSLHSSVYPPATPVQRSKPCGWSSNRRTDIVGHADMHTVNGWRRKMLHAECDAARAHLLNEEVKEMRPAVIIHHVVQSGGRRCFA